MPHKRKLKSKLNVFGKRRTVKSVKKDIKLATELRTRRENLRHLKNIRNIKEDESTLIKKLLSGKKFV